MKSKTGCLILCFVIVFSMTAALSPTACALSPSIKVTMKSGDTVYGLCQSMGLDYHSNKNTILKLNGFSDELRLNNLAVGTELLLPDGSCEDDSALCNGDYVAFYLMPYLFSQGNTISKIYYCWGLDYEDYEKDIKYLNGIKNLDKIYDGKLLYLPTDAANLRGDDYTTVIGHVMCSGETAYEVCQRYDLDYYDIQDELERFNYGGDMTKLQAGQTLNIPLI